MSRIQNEKNSLRQSFLTNRRHITQAIQREADMRVMSVLAEFLPQLAGEGASRRIAAHQPFGTEPGATLRPSLPQRLEDQGWEVLLPITLADKDLDWRRIDSDTPLGVEAIEECSVVITPALAVSTEGARLGRGGGSYDRALDRTTHVPIVVLLHDGDFGAHIPTEPHDQKVTAVITPSDGLTYCTSS